MSIGADNMLAKADAWECWINEFQDKIEDDQLTFLQGSSIDIGDLYDEGCSVESALDYINELMLEV